jgi:disulfide bond formation protein DsbB
VTAFLSALFGLLSLLVQVAAVAAVVVALRAGRRGALPPALAEAVRAHALGAVALVAGVATLGSIYYSEVAGFVPCELCWVQRIFAYPIALLATVALVRHGLRLRHEPGAVPDRQVWVYLVPLAALGLPVSVYHVLLQRLPTLDAGVCDPSVPCSGIWVQQFGFITIPWMAGSVFAFVLASALLVRLAARSHEPRTEEGVNA